MAQTAQPQPKKKPRSSLKRSRNEKQKPFDPIEFKKAAAQADQGTLNELRKFDRERRSSVTRTSGGGIVDPFAPQGTAWVDAFGPKRDSVRQRQEELNNNGRMTPDVFNMAKQAVSSRQAEMQNAIPFTQYQQPPEQLPFWQRPSGMVQDNPNGGRQLDSPFGQGSFNPGQPVQIPQPQQSPQEMFGGSSETPWGQFAGPSQQPGQQMQTQNGPFQGPMPPPTAPPGALPISQVRPQPHAYQPPADMQQFFGSIPQSSAPTMTDYTTPQTYQPPIPPSSPLDSLYGSWPGQSSNPGQTSQSSQSKNPFVPYGWMNPSWQDLIGSPNYMRGF